MSGNMYGQCAQCGGSLTTDHKCSDAIADKPSMTQEECENWIMLKGQSGERWFEIRILDEEVGQDPNMIKLMEITSDMIFKGMMGMPFTESETQRAKESKIKLVEG